ncbi:RidA family protein [Amycolatopsis rubida]|uniref:Enamine deaminase RidA, house cleaning of reactive enamine intermediates, YjgF/YER057c/UK114 family n=1 Tax=Amycolatopsis rubida TaxID=112413 RepID=A0A1I5V7I0_9PSEU|nr:MULTISPECIES: RidA family protein [Amycolatopsis]MYW90089.1 RidA family protein [Amycolatopsis rubida]NEC55066.1 RidA family protein [Amycolatopsis rubida]OAP21168.1 2-aminomuconate deaminase [Amycolatopsis sp. M39]SFQ03489.1 Enamine deaminase RidA, house cleaning of reactive enamine intermediates, YjgF/YER057c/UK114 family [Amycolatopsis rubida]
MSKRWNPGTVAGPVGRYSHLAQIPADHELVVVAGQIGARPDGTLAGPDAEAQTREALANIERLLAAAGAGPEHLVKVFSMVAGTEHLAGFRAASGDVLSRWFPESDWPPQSLIVVSALAKPELAVEIEAMAAVPR